MAIFTGTTGDDTLVGGAANDQFNPLLGRDSVNGGGGFDTLTLDWSGLLVNAGVSTISAGPAGSFSGSLAVGTGSATSLLFADIEALVATFSAGGETVVLDGAPLAAGATVNLNGGAGFDTLKADFSVFSNTSFAQGSNFLISSSHGTFGGFEQFDLTLGGGSNTVTLQGGADTIRSSGGIDQIDGGAGRDVWLADFSDWSSAISFGWDGDRNLAAVSNGTNVQRVEGGAIVGGTGDDAFFVNGLNPFDVDGGAGRDMLIWDESGHLAAGYSAIFEDGGAGSFAGSIQFSGFSSIEQVNVALSDADNYAFVDTAPLAGGATMNLDGGGGSDTLDVDYSGFADTSFAIDESGTAFSSHGTFGHFEHFGMALGGGTNVVGLGGGDDTVYSLGGLDQVDGGAGFDFWGGDYSEKTGNLAFTWNGNTGSGSLSSGTAITGFETGYVLTGAGNDAFILTGLMPFDVSGGAGFDTLIRNDTGLVGANPDSFILSAGTWFAGWAGNGQFDGIEQVTATFGDDDNTVFVDAAPLASGAGLSLNGGAGVDRLLIDFSALAGTVFNLGAGNVVTGNRGNFSGFEAYLIALGGGANTVTTGAGNDTVEAGGAGTSTIATGDGDDEIWGGTGAETVLGGAGVDRFHVAGAAAGYSILQDGFGGYVLTDTDPLNGNHGTDHLANVEWVDFADGSAALPFYGVGATFTGTAGNDVLTGTAFGDVLLGLSGNDKLLGGDGDDLLNGGAGSDTITGGSGVDTLSYEDAAAAVRINLASLGVAQLTGGSGSDWLVDALERLRGSALGDTLVGNALGNRIEGLAGNDTIDGGAGADTLVGGLGNDTYTVDSALDVATENVGEGTDAVTAKVNWTLGAEFENLTLFSGTAGFSGTGNELVNVLTGNAGANALYGLGGNDRLDGGLGADTMVGGAGNDTYTVDNVLDLVTESLGEGTDAVTAKVNWALSANVENLTLFAGTVGLTGEGNDLANVMTGNAGANVLSGFGGNDRLDGGLGADTLVGGFGNDTYVVENIGDTAVENVGEGTDVVTAQIGWTLGANFENLILLGTAAIDGSGNAAANVLSGNAAANTLTGLAGNDTLMAAGGNDLLVGGAGADFLTGGAGGDTFRFDVLETAAIKDTITDFLHLTDKLELVRGAFTAFAGDAAGALNPLELALGTAATTSAHHVVYNQATGALFYDGDGAGGAAQVQIALLSTKPLLSAADFLLL